MNIESRNATDKIYKHSNTRIYRHYNYKKDFLTVTKKFEEAIAAGETLLNDDDFKNLSAKLKEAAERKGITID